MPNLVYHGWKCISEEMSLVVNVPTVPYNYAEPDEFRIAPHGTLPTTGPERTVRRARREGGPASRFS